MDRLEAIVVAIASFFVGLCLLGMISVANQAVAHGVRSRCVTEEYIKVIERYDVQEGHVHYRCVHPDYYVEDFITEYYRNPAVSRTVRESVCTHKRFWKRQHGITIMTEACDGY